MATRPLPFAVLCITGHFGLEIGHFGLAAELETGHFGLAAERWQRKTKVELPLGTRCRCGQGIPANGEVSRGKWNGG